jgi:hypothetical protein
LDVMGLCGLFSPHFCIQFDEDVEGLLPAYQRLDLPIKESIQRI